MRPKVYPCCVHHRGLRVWLLCRWLQLRCVWHSLKAMRRTALGNRVRYRGETWTITNWADSPRSTLHHADGRRKEYVPREEFTPVRTPREFFYRARVRYWWWMTSWHGIAVHERLGRIERMGLGGQPPTTNPKGETT